VFVLPRNLSTYLSTCYFDVTTFPMASFINLPIVELLTKLFVAIAALATAAYEFFRYISNHKVSEMLQTSN
jgi:hypothetical protein